MQQDTKGIISMDTVYKNAFSVLQPLYYKKFQCDPIKCHETCCDRWKITIDKKTYQKYMESDNETIKEIVSTGLSKNIKSNSDEEFGVINLNEDLKCPFLNQEGYCQVIINMGENSLSKTCKNYPRATFLTNDVIERGLEMSCSVAAELALLDKDALIFEKIPEANHSRGLSINVMDIDESDSLKVFNEVRFLIIEILQNRKEGLNERVYAVGHFLNQIVVHKTFPNINYEEILSIVNKVRISFDDNDFTSKLTDSHLQYKDQFNILNTLLSMKFKETSNTGFSSKRYIECLWQVLDAFGNIKDENIAAYYKKNYEKYLKPYLDKKEFILENFLVNYVFIYREEIFDIEKIWHFYIKLCVVYGLIKFNLIGLAISNKGMHDELALKLIQSLTKTIIPDYNYLKSATDYLKETSKAELSDLNILFMNS